jgi:hypothetical protein
MHVLRRVLAVLALGAAVAAPLPARAELPGSVTVTVTDFRGAPAVQTGVFASTDPYYHGRVFSFQTDSAGHGSATGVPAGTYYLTFEPLRFTTDSVGPFTQTLTVVSGETVHVDFQLPASDWVSGRVTNRVTHKGLPGVEVQAHSQCRYAGDLCDGMYGYTDADGYYTIHSLIADSNWPGTEYRVTLYSRDVSSPLQTTYTVATQPGLGHPGLDFKRLTKNPDLPSI